MTQVGIAVSVTGMGLKYKSKQQIPKITQVPTMGFKVLVTPNQFFSEL